MLHVGIPLLIVVILMKELFIVDAVLYYFYEAAK